MLPILSGEKFKYAGQTHLNPNTVRTLHDGVLKPFKQSVDFQEKHAVATLHRNQMGLPCLSMFNFLTQTNGKNKFH
jgi:hypothetical protein